MSMELKKITSMYYVTSDYAKNHFDEILKRAKGEPDGVLIVQDNKSFVLIDREELEAWAETKEWLEESDLLSDIKKAREEYAEGETLTMDEMFS